MNQKDIINNKIKKKKISVDSTKKIILVVMITIFSLFSIWHSTHILSLEQRTKEFNLKKDFGYYKYEKDNSGRKFRWTGKYGGIWLKIKKPLITIPILASHPDIKSNPVRLKIFVYEDFFKDKNLLDEIILNDNLWKTFSWNISDKLGKDIILLFQVNRTWTPYKWRKIPDYRKLGIAIGDIH